MTRRSVEVSTSSTLITGAIKLGVPPLDGDQVDLTLRGDSEGLVRDSVSVFQGILQEDCSDGVTRPTDSVDVTLALTKRKVVIISGTTRSLRHGLTFREHLLGLQEISFEVDSLVFSSDEAKEVFRPGQRVIGVDLTIEGLIPIGRTGVANGHLPEPQQNLSVGSLSRPRLRPKGGRGRRAGVRGRRGSKHDF